MRASAHKFSQKVVGEAGVRLVSTFFVLFLARRVGAENFGLYSTGMAYAAFCAVLVDLGINYVLTREIARQPERRIAIAESSHSLKMAAAITAWILLFALTEVFHFSHDEQRLTLYLAIAVIGYSLTDYLSAMLSGIEEMGWEATLKVTSRTLALLLAFVALARHQPLRTIALMMACGAVLSYAVSAVILRTRFGAFGYAWDSGFIRSLLRSCLPIFGSVVFWVLYDSQDILLLRFFNFLPQDIGFFSAAMKVIDVARVYPILVLGVFFPTLSKLHVSDPPAFVQKQRRVFLFMMSSLASMSGALYLAAPWIVQILYKADYLPAARYLQLLAPAIVLMGLNYTQVQSLIAKNRERTLLSGAILACVVNLGLACLLLPRCGVAGTCYALLGSEFVYFMFLSRSMRGV